MAEARPQPVFGGRLSLDLTWTLAHRLWAPTEYLTSDEDVATWLVAAGVVPAGTPPADGTLRSARDLREAVYRSAHRRIAGQMLDRGDVQLINRWAHKPTLVPTLATDATVQWGSRQPIHAGLAAVAVDAALLLAEPGSRLRECSREGCAGLYFDASPAGRRRWCSAARCGNAVNTARYRRRVSGSE